MSQPIATVFTTCLLFTAYTRFELNHFHLLPWLFGQFLHFCVNFALAAIASGCFCSTLTFHFGYWIAMEEQQQQKHGFCIALDWLSMNFMLFPMCRWMLYAYNAPILLIFRGILLSAHFRQRIVANKRWNVYVQWSQIPVARIFFASSLGIGPLAARSSLVCVHHFRRTTADDLTLTRSKTHTQNSKTSARFIQSAQLLQWFAHTSFTNNIFSFFLLPYRISTYKNINRSKTIRIIKTISMCNRSRSSTKQPAVVRRTMASHVVAWPRTHSSCKRAARSTRRSIRKSKLCLPNSRGSAPSDGRWVLENILKICFVIKVASV